LILLHNFKVLALKNKRGTLALLDQQWPSRAQEPDRKK
jgi:hypothetical protein